MGQSAERKEQLAASSRQLAECLEQKLAGSRLLAENKHAIQYSGAAFSSFGKRFALSTNPRPVRRPSGAPRVVITPDHYKLSPSLSMLLPAVLPSPRSLPAARCQLFFRLPVRCQLPSAHRAKRMAHSVHITARCSPFLPALFTLPGALRPALGALRSLPAARCRLFFPLPFLLESDFRATTTR
jgi:hypothetical protein